MPQYFPSTSASLYIWMASSLVGARTSTRQEPGVRFSFGWRRR